MLVSSARKTEWDHDHGALAAARREGREGDHLLRRSVTVVKDEVLKVGEPGSRNGGELVVAGDEYAAIREANYYCSCGEEFDSVDGAEAHLLEAAGDTDEDTTRDTDA